MDGGCCCSNGPLTVLEEKEEDVLKYVIFSKANHNLLFVINCNKEKIKFLKRF